MRLLVCGGREWSDATPISDFIVGLVHKLPHLTVVEGECRGPDRIAGGIARSLGVPVESFPADWQGKGRGAGFIRNREMLDSGVDLVIAFKDGFDFTYQSGGTENMVKIAKAAGIPTLVVSHG